MYSFALLRWPINGFKTGRRVFYPVCLKQGNKLRPVFFVFLKGVRVSKPQQPTYIKKLDEYLRCPETEGKCTLCDGGGGTKGGSEVDCSV